MLHAIQVTVIYSGDVFVAVTSECCIKSIICKPCAGLNAGTFANSADPDQMPQNAASEHGLHCLLELQEFIGSMKQSKVTVHNHFPSLQS